MVRTKDNLEITHAHTYTAGYFPFPLTIANTWLDSQKELKISQKDHTFITLIFLLGEIARSLDFQDWIWT